MARAVLAGALALVLLSIRRVPLPAREHWRPLALTALGAVFGWPVFLALALERTTAAHASVIAAFMPLMTAVFAVLLVHERVTRGFWAAAGVGTVALVVFAVARGGLEGGGLAADAFVVIAVLSSSLCYVLGASVTRAMPGWQVISWVVVLALPVTVPATAVLWITTRSSYDPGPAQWGALAFLGVSSMYLAFFAWYRGLAQAGIAYGGQVQQVQAPLSLLWAALLLGEAVTWLTIAATGVVVGAVAWAQRSRRPTVVAPEE
jgi:drug/metabolite transporter (DMT)-like permease